MEPMIVRPCLVCDKPTAVALEKWSGEAPAAFCLDCCKLIKDGRIPWPVVRMLFLVRCGLVQMQTDMTLVKRDVQRIFNWQQEVDAERVRA